MATGGRPAEGRVSGGTRLRGRQAQAAQNDELILKAAQEVFLADPTAPISAVAERAGVGIGALYHRYAGKEDLLRTLCRNGQQTYLAEIRRALASDDKTLGSIHRVPAADRDRQHARPDRPARRDVHPERGAAGPG